MYIIVAETGEFFNGYHDTRTAVRWTTDRRRAFQYHDEALANTNAAWLRRRHKVKCTVEVGDA